MSNEASKTRENERERNGAGGEMEEIRQLLLAPDRNQLRKLKERTEDPVLNAEMVSQVLPDAVRLRTQQDGKLTASLLPTVEEAIAVSVKKSPEVLAAAIFPLMGPAIRKAIAAALSAMLTSLNQTMEQSLSPQSLKWRLEALRTGKTYAEVVLLRTLEYRVEQVFLIDRHTGLLLHHVVLTALAGPGADTIAAMLTAIQDFVRDSFHAGANEEVDALQVGELRVWIERGPKAVLAAVIRGDAPVELRTLLQETVETIHREYAGALERFDGDSAPFESCDGLLRECLTSRYQSKPAKSSRGIWIAAAGAAVVIALLLFFPWLRKHRWNGYVDTLRAQPGIVVIEADRKDGKYRLVGLRDPLAANPLAFLEAAKLKEKDVDERWEPYASSYPAFVLARAGNLINVPQSVSLRVENGVLFASGAAPAAWIETARARFRGLGGIYRYDDSGLSAPTSASLESVVRNLESRSIDFRINSAGLTGGAMRQLKDVETGIQSLRAKAGEAHKLAVIQIVGHAEPTGAESRNDALSLQRADAVLSRLRADGVDTKDVTATGNGSRAEANAAPPRPSVSFRVELKEM
jgi:OOP family OmpA-OmpF porin